MKLGSVFARNDEYVQIERLGELFERGERDIPTSLDHGNLALLSAAPARDLGLGQAQGTASGSKCIRNIHFM